MLLYVHDAIHQKTPVMRKLILLIPVILTGLMLISSCKKDWTCICTYNGASTPVTYYDMTKAQAEINCVGHQTVSGVSCKIN